MGLCCDVDEDYHGSEELDNTSESSIVFSGIKKNRRCTDINAGIFMAVFFTLLAFLLGYCIINGDIYRLYNGYDDCGNVCGKENKVSGKSPIDCFGQDMTKNGILFIKTENVDGNNYTRKECVESCEMEGGTILFLNRCFPSLHVNGVIVVQTGLSSFINKISDDLQVCWRELVLLSFLALVFSIIMMILYRYATAFVVWFTLIGMCLICIGGTIYLWLLYNNSTADLSEYDNRIQSSNYLIAAIVCTFVTFILLLIILVMFKRIKLVIQLFKEAAKAVAAMPALLLQPVVTFIIISIILAFAFYFNLWIQSSGDLKISSQAKFNTLRTAPNMAEYQLNSFEMFISWYNLFAMLWIIQFAIGCQHIIVGGSVATWFFSRDKNNLGNPITENATNVFRYHLGTVALGSLIITIVEFIKVVIQTIKGSLNDKKSLIACLLNFLLRYVLEWVEAFLKYFSRNAYIQTAIYGYPFCKAGKKAFTLLVHNIFKVFAINSVGDFVLSFAKLFIVLTTVLIGFEMFRDKSELHYLWFPLVLIGIISYFIAHCFLTVFEMAIDTIFLCFCEDCEQNDGLSKPYYMSRNLMEFVENSSKVLNKKVKWDDEQRLAWENGPKRIQA